MMAKNNPGNRLYHYTSFETLVFYILPQMRLLLNPIINTNDPRENKSYVFNTLCLSKHAESLKSKLGDKSDEIISNYIRKGVKTLCFCEDNEYNEWLWGCCLSGMWAHYGSNHQGICIELNKEKFIEENKQNIQIKFFEKINYVNLKPNAEKSRLKFNFDDALSNSGIKNYIKTNYRKENSKHLFFTKNLEWKFENETRLIYFSENKLKEYCSIKDSITNIYLGMNFNYDKLSVLKLLIKNSAVDLMKIEYRDIHLIREKI
jgi:hypothetical protein